MAEWIDVPVDFLKDNTIRLTYKVSVIIVALTLGLVINDVFGLTRNWLISRKLEQIKELQSIDSLRIAKDTAVAKKLTELTNNIVHEQGYIGIMYSRLHYLFKDTTYTAASTSMPAADASEVKASHHFWYMVTAMFMFYIMLFIVVPLGLFYTFFVSSESSKEKVTIVAGFIIIVVVSYGIQLLYRYLIELIPIFDKAVWINYSINLAGQLIIAVILISIYRRQQAKKPAA